KFGISFKAGTYEYYCKLHPWLIGFVHVSGIPSTSNNQPPISNATETSFPVAYSTLLSIWNQRPDLQKTFPEAAQGNLTGMKEWATDFGWKQDKRLSALIPPGKVPSYSQLPGINIDKKMIPVILAMIAGMITITGVLCYKFY